MDKIQHYANTLPELTSAWVDMSRTKEKNWENLDHQKFGSFGSPKVWITKSLDHGKYPDWACASRVWVYVVKEGTRVRGYEAMVKGIFPLDAYAASS